MILFEEDFSINNLSKEEIKRKIIDIRREIVSLESIKGNFEKDILSLKEIKIALEKKKQIFNKKKIIEMKVKN